MLSCHERSTFAGGTLLVLRLTYGSAWDIDGIFSLFAVLFFLGGQFLGLGPLGEYLGRVYLDVRAGPRFFIRDVTNFGKPRGWRRPETGPQGLAAPGRRPRP